MPEDGRVRASWERSAAAGVDPGRARPRRAYDRDRTHALRAAHPLAATLPVLRDTLLAAATQSRQVMIVTDGRGHLLWCEGSGDVLRRADRAGAVEGTCWSEEIVGTTAVGVALAEGRPARVHAGEHWTYALRSWTCAAAPVRDPDTGHLLGTAGLAGAADTTHPTTLSLVTAAARLAEHRLSSLTEARDQRIRDTNLPHLARLGDAPGALLSPHGRVLAASPAGRFRRRIALPERGDSVVLDDGAEGRLEPLGEGWLLRVPDPQGPARPVLTLPFLGTRSPVAHRDGRPIRLGLRHAEVLTLLALRPEGMTAEQLAVALYGDDGLPITVRAEMHRLRRQLGEDIIRPQPYRLTTRVDADFLRLRQALRDGRVHDAAAEAARGPLLPTSESPAVRTEREHLTVATRAAVLRSGDPDAMWTLVRAGEADDELRLRLRYTLPSNDPRRDELA